MFERFTEQARQVVVFAQGEARSLKHNYIGTEHLLLGLLRSDNGVAAEVLTSLGVSVESVRAQVARIIGHGDESVSGQIPFTPRAKKVLELAVRETLALGQNAVANEHILLGLARENEGVASRILLDFGANGDRIREAVFSELGVEPPLGYVAAAPVPGDYASFDAVGRPWREPWSTMLGVPLIVAWILFAATLGLGILIGWLIWG